MTINNLKLKVSKYLIEFFNLTRIGRQRFISQWGIISISYQNNLMWIQLLDKKVSIILEDRKDLSSYVEETIRELIPYDIINEDVQYKIF